MLGAITYQEMLQDINNKPLKEDSIGILITRPELDSGREILKNLNYYHHLSGKSKNFYLPGYGAYWYGTYPDGRVVTQIDNVEWSFSDKMFVEFITEIQLYSTWKFTGESELLIVEYKDGVLSFEKMLRFYLDRMIKDKKIESISAFFQKLLGGQTNGKMVDEISNILKKDGLTQIIGGGLLNKIPPIFAKGFMQEKYFSVRDYRKY